MGGLKSREKRQTWRRWEPGGTAVCRCLSKLIPQTDFAARWRREIHYGRIYSSPSAAVISFATREVHPGGRASDRSAVTRSGFSHTLHRCLVEKKKIYIFAKIKKKKENDLHHRGLIWGNKPQTALSQKIKSLCLEKRISGQYFWTATIWGFAKINKLVRTSINKWTREDTFKLQLRHWIIHLRSRWSCTWINWPFVLGFWH